MQAKKDTNQSDGLIKRAQCRYQLLNSRFLLQCDFARQYNQYYNKRLSKALATLLHNAKLKWPNVNTIENYDSLTPSQLEQDDFGERNINFDDGNSTATSNFSSTMYNVESNSSHCVGLDAERFDVATPGGSLADQRIQPMNDESKPSIMIGTIFKKMKMQPDLIEELSNRDWHINCEKYIGHYASPDDSLVLQDSKRNIALTGLIDPGRFVTGVIVALLGHQLNDGAEFHVLDVCFAEPTVSKMIDRDIDGGSTESHLEYPMNGLQDNFILLISDLGFDDRLSRNSSLVQALQLLIDFVWGGTSFENDERSSKISRILVAGNCLSDSRHSNSNEDEAPMTLNQRIKSVRQIKPRTSSVQSIKNLDDFFSQLSKTVNVDVMPGPKDPTTHLFPQQPFHPCMFPKSIKYSSFNCTTNPHEALYNDRQIFGTSGQNVDIIRQYSKFNNSIDIMKHHLKWGHCAPNAPDNLYSTPYEDEDPFTIDERPSVYFTGCQPEFRIDHYNYEDCIEEALQLEANSEFSTSNPVTSSGNKFETRLSPISKTLLVTVPQFYKTHSCVLVNLRDLSCHLMKFS